MLFFTDGEARFYEAHPLIAAVIAGVTVFIYLVLARKRLTARWRLIRSRDYRRRLGITQ
jgi:hypothetical protein